MRPPELAYIKLTRSPGWDRRNLNHLVPVSEAVIPARKTHRRYVWLDQGATPACTGYSAATALAYAPHSVRVDDGLSAFAYRAYRQAQQLDQWLGDGYEGSSILGAAQAVKAAGFISKYEWATSIKAVTAGLNTGPVVLGISWLTGMFTPDNKGIIRATGEEEGGHAICIGAQRGSGSWFRLDNTWGRDWGVNGSAWISAVDLAMLLSPQLQGEALVPVKVRRLPDWNVLPEVRL